MEVSPMTTNNRSRTESRAKRAKIDDPNQLEARLANPAQARAEVTAWWGQAATTITTLAQQMDEIAAEGYHPASPLFGFVDPVRWGEIADALLDCGLVENPVRAEVAYPLATLKAAGLKVADAA